jgi:acyl transferase domain-containing protein/enoyl-[acyl-carrier-protein] reductase (NADH)/aryl carrier-like protein
MRKELTVSVAHPVLRDHRVYGQSVLPGLAYIDLLYQLFREGGYDYRCLELRNLSIYNSLALEQGGEVRLEIEGTMLSDDRWRIVVEGRQQRNGIPKKERQRYVTAEMHRVGRAAFDERIEPRGARRTATRMVDIEELYASCRHRELIHGEFMRARGTLVETDSEIYADCSVDGEASDSSGLTMFHPTLVDASALIGCFAHLSSYAVGREKLLLPIFYESFRASELLQRRSLARIQKKCTREGGELVYLTIEFFDETGKKVAELANLAAKEVSDPSAMDLSREQATESRRIVDASMTSRDSGDEARAMSEGAVARAELLLRQVIAEQLQIPVDAVDTQVGFFDLGLNSAVLLELVHSLEARIGTRLAPTLLFEFTTIKGLAEHLYKQYNTVFDDAEAEAKASKLAPASEGVTSKTPLGAKADDPSVTADCGQAIEDRGEDADSEGIAIVGMGGRFPQASNVREYWDNLLSGKDCVTEIPIERWHRERLDGIRSPSGKSMSKWGGFLDHVDCFDSEFFRMSPREAEILDPQERLFLEVCWEAMEDAGYEPNTLSLPTGPNGRREVGVFAGVIHKEYALVQAEEVFQGRPSIVSLSNSSIANRVSYFCNFHGPSIVVDTACSSSLSAVHLALQSIRHGDSNVALAGGVNLSVHPAKYMTCGMMDMHSSDGRCRSFGHGGSGYVSAEGVGAVVLKPTRQAVEDGDSIYAIIKASTVNHVGAVSGITVPNPVAQTELIVGCLEQAKIHPRTISYVEAHGTGTPLGDPIEIEGLSRAYRRYTDDVQFCAIGSVKSNIGHAESAAGISGLIKVALQLRHAMLVPSLHAEESNEYIDWRDSPFFVQRNLKHWEATEKLIDGRVVPLPRRAAVSSFGATGSNAHLILEECPLSTMAQRVGSGKLIQPSIIPLSASNKERLYEYALRLLDFLNTLEEPVAGTDGDQQLPARSTGVNLTDLAYTLQTGRREFGSRVAFVASDLAALIKGLENFKENRNDSATYFVGEAKQAKDLIALLSSDGDMDDITDQLLKKNKIRKLAALWVNGFQVEWRQLYGDLKPHRVSLPTYPFAKERHWASRVIAGDTLQSERNVSPLHPLVRENTSSLSRQRYTSTFSGREFFLADHLVRGRKVLPGVAYLEMARAAVEFATRDQLSAASSSIQLKNVVWSQAIVVDETPRQIHVELYPQRPDEIAFEICSAAPGGAIDRSNVGDEVRGHSQGLALIRQRKEAPTIDLQALRARCVGVALTAEQCYSLFDAMDLHYGGAHRGLETVAAGTTAEGSQFALARIAVPASVMGTHQDFCLHPSLLDSALQSSIGLMRGSDHKITDGASMQPMLPFALDSLEIFGSCAAQCYAVIRAAAGATGVQKLDLDLCDENGRVAVQLRGLTSRAYNGEMQNGPAFEECASTKVEERELFTFEEHWQCEALTKPVDGGMDKVICLLPDATCSAMVHQAFEHLGARLEVICFSNDGRYCKHHRNHYSVASGDIASLRDALRDVEREHGQIDALVHLVAFEDQRGLADYGAIASLVQAMASAGTRCAHLVLAGQYRTGVERCYLESWIGFGRSLKTALPGTKVSVVGSSCATEKRAGTGDWVAQCISRLWGELRQGNIEDVLYCEGERHVCRLNRSPRQAAVTALRTGGTYLITGGAGGLGLLVARHLIEKYAANVILTGRTQLSEEQAKGVRALDEIGGQVLYLQANVCDQAHMKEVVEQIHERFGSIHGVIHAAGIAPHGNILEGTQSGFERALAPKLQGTLVLDELLINEKIDFVCYFSSSAAMLGDFGACSYAVGNRFQMAYAHYRTRQVKEGKGYGKTLAINWPLWADGGMRLGDASVTRTYLEASGQRALRAEEALLLFEQLLAEPAAQQLVMVGYPSSVSRLLGLQANMVRSAGDVTPSQWIPSHLSDTSSDGFSADILETKAAEYFRKLLASTLKLPPARVEADAPLEKYGIDSIVAMKLTTELERSFGSLSKTLFFEHQSLESLSRHFATTHRSRLMQLLGMVEQGPRPRAAADSVASVTPFRLVVRRNGIADRKYEADDIAIIGISGRYPGADTLEEFWENLKAGKDCITEIPAQRWDHSQYFDAEKGTPGKSYCKWGGFIEGVDQFDSMFFNISPREAEAMDPQVGLYLESVWTLLEASGYTRQDLRDRYGNRVGLYVGSMYPQKAIAAGGAVNSLSDISSHSAIANRVSYFFGFKGPSVAIDTMCSSAMMAIHMACKDLLQGECEIAIAGGVNLSLQPNKFVGLSEAQFIGSRFDSRSFAEGDGYLPAEAVGAVLLKRLPRAVADQDDILAVVKATATNHSGHGNGYAIPNPRSQAELIQGVIEKAGIEAQTISYVEAAANGSSLGDAIEMRALEQAFSSTTGRTKCAIGSVKSNIGHAEAASGISQLTKVILQMRHRQLVPTRRPEPINPSLNLEKTPFNLQYTLQEWKRTIVEQDGGRHETPLRALINSFPAGGSYVSMVLEEYATADLPSESTDASAWIHGEIVVLSAQDSERLTAAASRLLEHLSRHADIMLPDLAYTLQVGREAMSSRVAWTVRTTGELRRALELYIGMRTDVSDDAQDATVYRGDAGGDGTNLKRLMAGVVGNVVVERLLMEQDLEKIALLWAQGGEIPWEQLHCGRRVRKIALPTYPFRREHVGIAATCQSATMPDRDRPRSVQRLDAINEFIFEFLSNELGIQPGQLNPNRNLRDYGVDSLMGRRLLRGLEETFSIAISGKQMLASASIEGLLTLIAQLDNGAIGAGRSGGTVAARLGPNLIKSATSAAHAGNHARLLLECFKEGAIEYDDMRMLIRQGSVI